MPSAPEAYADDVALVERCLTGDLRAQEAIFDREFPRVNATLFRILGPTPDKDDLVQETFLEVFRSLPRYRARSKLSTWIDGIAANVARRYLRDKARAAPTVVLELVPEPAAASRIDEQVVAREGVRRLYDALDRLTPDQRMAFALRTLDGRSMKEIAKLMGASVVATRVRIHRARKELERRAARDPVLAAFFRAHAKEPA